MPPISASAAMRSAFSPLKASAPASSSGRWRYCLQRCSRFGMVVKGVRSNEHRMQAIGFRANRYGLVCFVISGTICGLSGALLANTPALISPAVMYWTRSGDLMVMVVLGGMGSLFGPVIGAIAFLLLEEFLSQFTEYWSMIMGPLLLLIVLFARGCIIGILGLLSRG